MQQTRTQSQAAKFSLLDSRLAAGQLQDTQDFEDIWLILPPLMIETPRKTKVACQHAYMPDILLTQRQKRLTTSNKAQVI